MTEPKKGGARRIIDVSHPGKSAPSSTSKPVLVTNRPILKDPMMVENSLSDIEDKADKSLSKPSGKANITPLTAPELKTNEKDKTDKDKEDRATEEVKSDTSRTITEVAAAANADDKPADKPADEKSEAEPSEAKDDKAEPDGDGKSSVQTPQEAEAELAVQQKKDEALRELIESKKYYLPINSVEQRRSKRFVALGIVLSLVLALAWVDVALDAGLVKLDGVKPVTHFFSN